MRWKDSGSMPVTDFVIKYKELDHVKHKNNIG